MLNSMRELEWMVLYMSPNWLTGSLKAKLNVAWEKIEALITRPWLLEIMTMNEQEPQDCIKVMQLSALISYGSKWFHNYYWCHNFMDPWTFRLLVIQAVWYLALNSDMTWEKVPRFSKYGEQCVYAHTPLFLKKTMNVIYLIPHFVEHKIHTFI